MVEVNRQAVASDPSVGAVFPVAPSGTADSCSDAGRRQEAIVALGRRAVAPPALPILLQDAAALLAEMFDSEYSGVAEVLPDGRKIRHYLTCRNDAGDSTPCDIQEIALGNGSSLAGYALQVAHPVVVTDLTQEKRFTDLFLRGHGVFSAVAVPLKLHGEAFGALGAYSVYPRHFRKDDVLFTETIGHLIATTIGRCRAEEQLLLERTLSQGVLQAVDALVLVLDPQWRIIHVNRACQKTTGFAADEIVGRPVWNVFTVQEEAGWYRTLMDRCRESGGPVEYESYLQTKHGGRRRIAWRYQSVHDPHGNVSSVVATGIDITDRCNAEKRLCEAEQEMAVVQRELAAIKEAQQRAADVAPATEEGRPTISPFSSLPTPLNAERRGRPRRSYPYAQRVAPIVKGELPKEGDFAEIECNDIGAGGFSFFAAQPPVSDMLVVALGTPPKVTHLTAQVAHITRQERNGRRMYLIGCSYTGRIHY